MTNGDTRDGGAGSQETEQDRHYREQEQRLRERAARIKHVVLIISGKGGVGKSTVAANVAYGLAGRGLAIGLLDADLHGPSIALMTGLTGQRAYGTAAGITPLQVMPNLFVMSMAALLDDDTTPVIWRGPLRANVIRQFIADVEWPALDCLVVDLPPGTGDEPLTVAQALPSADGAVVVTTPQEASLSDCRKAVRFVQKVGLPVLGVVENMSGLACPHCGQTIDVFSSGGGEVMARQMQVPFLGRVPLAPEIVRLSDGGRSVFSNGVGDQVREALGSVVMELWRSVDGQ
jgi:ATP-binding protein involved in chromosome partitioning